MGTWAVSQILATVNNAAMNRGVHIFFLMDVSGSVFYFSTLSYDYVEQTTLFKVYSPVSFDTGICVQNYHHDQD